MEAVDGIGEGERRPLRVQRERLVGRGRDVARQIDGLEMDRMDAIIGDGQAQRRGEREVANGVKRQRRSAGVDCYLQGRDLRQPSLGRDFTGGGDVLIRRRRRRGGDDVHRRQIGVEDEGRAVGAGVAGLVGSGGLQHVSAVVGTVELEAGREAKKTTRVNRHRGGRLSIDEDLQRRDGGKRVGHLPCQGDVPVGRRTG